MLGTIYDVLETLETQSKSEKSKKFDIAPEDRMLAITKETGEMLNMLLRLKMAKNMLEIGTSVGYSAIWCAEAIREQSGKIITIEQNPSKIKRALDNFKRAGVADMITVKQGLAIDILQDMGMQNEYDDMFDLVLIDADKENICEYFDLIFPMVSVGGVIVTDNMLYPEKYRQHMEEFSNRLKENPLVRTMTSPVGNGEEITIKIGS